MVNNSLLSIKDFSTLVGIKQSTLRYYDEIGLFSPIQRGENGYRYYSPQQITTINCIKLLHSLDMPIKEISRETKRRTPELILKLLMAEEQRLDEELKILNGARSIINLFKNNIFIGTSVDENEVSVIPMYEQSIIMGPVNEFANPDNYYDAFVNFCEMSETLRINLTYPIGGYFPNMESFREKPAQPERFFSLDPTGGERKNAGRYLVAYTRGPYGQPNNIAERLEKYAKKHDLHFTGPVYNIFLLDEVCESNPNEYLMQASVPVASTVS
jgi:DNA-binding transcriptional MerR regulator